MATLYETPKMKPSYLRFE